MHHRLIGMAACLVGAAAASTATEPVEALRADVERITHEASAALFMAPAELEGLRAQLAQKADARALDATLAAHAPIEVTINPEARVSVKRTAAPLPSFRCGEDGAWLVRIVNEGFVTAMINVRPVGESIKLIRVEPLAPHLTGATVEYRVLRFKSTAAGQIDVTLGFDAGPATSDIGKRSILPLLVTCRD